MTTEKQVTAEEALLWLAGLEKKCPCETEHVDMRCSACQKRWLMSGSGHSQYCRNDCNGSGKVPVLDLREPCPCLSLAESSPDGINHAYDQGICKPWFLRQGRTPNFHSDCFTCSERGWVPKEGEEALRQALHKAGWEVRFRWDCSGKYQHWLFFKSIGDGSLFEGRDSAIHIAAHKAMRQEGY